MANETTIDAETARRLLLILSLEGDVKREEIEWALGVIHQIPGYSGITMEKAVKDDFLREVLVAIAAEQLSSTTPKELETLIEDAQKREAALKSAKETGEKRAEEFIEAAEKAAKTKAQIKVPQVAPEAPASVPETPAPTQPVSEGFLIRVSPRFIEKLGKKAVFAPFTVTRFLSPRLLQENPAVATSLATSIPLSELSKKAEGLPEAERVKILRFVEAINKARYSTVARMQLPMKIASIRGIQATFMESSEMGLPQGQFTAIIQTAKVSAPSLLGGLGRQVLGGIAQSAISKGVTKLATKAITTALGTAVAPVVGTAISLAVGWLVDKGKDLLSWITRNAPKVAIGIGVFLFGTGFILQSSVLMAGGVGVGFGGFIGKSGGFGPALSKAGGLASSVIGGITSLTVASIATPLIVALISIPVLVAIILFIINSGAYLVPPGPARFGGIPPGGNLTKCNPNETGTEITEQLAASVDSGSVRFLPDYLGSRREGLCMTPTMIILHTSGGYDNDQGNSATYGTLVSRDRSCQLATDTNDTIFMLSFFEKQVESAWCSDDLNAGGVGIEMAGECQGGCAPVAKCSPNTSLTYQPNGPHPCPDLEDLSFDAICKTMQYYKIPWSQVFQHEASNGSHVDPIGDEWVDKFILRLKNNCRI